jgi:hypothetical protein
LTFASQQRSSSHPGGFSRPSRGLAPSPPAPVQVPQQQQQQQQEQQEKQRREQGLDLSPPTDPPLARGVPSRASLGSSIHPLSARTRSSRAQSPTLTVGWSGGTSGRFDSSGMSLGIGTYGDHLQPTVPRRFFERDHDMEVLMQALTESQRVRGECHGAAEAISRDFERNFSPYDHPFRRPARSLVIKSNNVATRLQASLHSVEDAAWESLNASHELSMEKEAVMATLADEVAHCDIELQREIRAMRVAIKKSCDKETLQGAVDRTVLCDELGHAEADMDASVMHITRLESRLGKAEANLRENNEATRKMREGHDRMVADAERMAAERDAEKALVDQLEAKLERAHEKFQQKLSAVTTENERLQAEVKELRGKMDDLEGVSGGEAKKLRAAEAEGGNLRAMATAACDKLEILEKVAEQLREDLSDANAKVAERDTVLVDLNRKLQLANAEKREIDTLRSVCLELQNVLKDAMKAATWKQCRQMLYHESLRYVSSAATHGKHGPTGETRIEPGLANKGLVRRESGRVIDGKGITKILSKTESMLSPTHNIAGDGTAA